jgi:hypothetical protein
MGIVTQGVLGVMITTALVCGTVLMLNGHPWGTALMVGFALAGLFVVGGVEIQQRHRGPDEGQAHE